MSWSKKVTCPDCKGKGYLNHYKIPIGNSYATIDFKSGCTRCGGKGNNLNKFIASRLGESNYGGLRKGSGKIPKSSLKE